MLDFLQAELKLAQGCIEESLELQVELGRIKLGRLADPRVLSSFNIDATLPRTTAIAGTTLEISRSRVVVNSGSGVEASRHAEGTVYVAFDNHASDDYGNYLYRSTDFGTTWASIAGDLPAGRVVVLTHAAAVDARLKQTADLVFDVPGLKPVLLLGPEHGFAAAAQDIVRRAGAGWAFVEEPLQAEKVVPALEPRGPLGRIVAFDSLSRLPGADASGRLEIALADVAAGASGVLALADLLEDGRHDLRRGAPHLDPGLAQRSRDPHKA